MPSPGVFHRFFTDGAFFDIFLKNLFFLHFFPVSTRLNFLVGFLISISLCSICNTKERKQ